MQLFETPLLVDRIGPNNEARMCYCEPLGMRRVRKGEWFPPSFSCSRFLPSGSGCLAQNSIFFALWRMMPDISCPLCGIGHALKLIMCLSEINCARL